ncbi:Caffeate O-methyltransferase (COMT) family [Artemisia annua]|uniref:Caffeate O-methyltransferase (COMT) family n=1 Tax=Artemisia annua TaxID=35608 RepID=A0A2U1KEX9_ARTAN|nr:Caffeate O-methyltransferase (COMT) family [Artemisia annua]
MDSTSPDDYVSDEANEVESILFAAQLATACTFPMVLKAAIELDLLEIIAKEGHDGSCSASELVAHVGATVNNPEAPMMLDRMCSLLTSHSVLTCSLKETQDGLRERFYSLAPVCKFLIKNEDGASLAPLMLMNHDKIFMECWYFLKDAVLDGGIPFHKAYGMSPFEYMGKDKRFNKVFNKGMFNHSTMVMKVVLDLYDGFDGLTTLVDVGGGLVALWILHDWSDADSLKILKNCYKALPENGKVIVTEFVLPEAPDSARKTR